ELLSHSARLDKVLCERSSLLELFWRKQWLHRLEVAACGLFQSWNWQSWERLFKAEHGAFAVILLVTCNFALLVAELGRCGAQHGADEHIPAGSVELFLAAAIMPT